MTNDPSTIVRRLSLDDHVHVQVDVEHGPSDLRGRVTLVEDHPPDADRIFENPRHVHVSVGEATYRLQTFDTVNGITPVYLAVDGGAAAPGHSWEHVGRVERIERAGRVLP